MSQMGSLASISACPQHVRLGGNLGNAGCPVLSVGGIGCHPNKPRGVPRVDDRRVLNSIFWVLALKCSLARPACPLAARRRIGPLAAGHDAAVQMIDTSVVRVYQRGTCIADNNHQDIGRSRGGPSSKIHAVVDADGLPVHLGLTPGEAHDNRLCSVLLGALPPQTMLLADRGYDADWISLPANKAPRPIFHRSAIAKTQSALAHNCISAVRRIFASSGFGGEYGRLPRIGRSIPHACSLSP